MLTKTSTVRGYFYDEDGDVQRTTLGPRPGLIIVLVVVILQALLVVAAVIYRPPQLLISDTEEWDVKYYQCECHTNLSLWVVIVYNTVLSLIITALSCTAVNMDDDFGELKHICVSVCTLFLDFFLFVAVVYGVELQETTMAIGVLSCLVGATFLVFYFVPKLRFILCTKAKPPVPVDSQPLIEPPPEEHQEQDTEAPTVIEASTPGTKRRIVQAKVKS